MTPHRFATVAAVALIAALSAVLVALAPVPVQAPGADATRLAAATLRP